MKEGDVLKIVDFHCDVLSKIQLDRSLDFKCDHGLDVNLERMEQGGVQLADIRPFPEGDLALGRLTPFDPNAWVDYPVFKSPGDLDVGTALCKIGYPFQRIHRITSYNVCYTKLLRLHREAGQRSCGGTKLEGIIRLAKGCLYPLERIPDFT